MDVSGLLLIIVATAAAAKSLQSCPTLCDLIDGSPPGSPVPGILQARTWGWVAISFSKAWKWKVKVKLLSHVRLFATPWTAGYQASPAMEFSRQEHWSGVPLPWEEIMFGVIGLNKLASPSLRVNVSYFSVSPNILSVQPLWRTECHFSTSFYSSFMNRMWKPVSNCASLFSWTPKLILQHFPVSHRTLFGSQACS